MLVLHAGRCGDFAFAERRKNARRKAHRTDDRFKHFARDRAGTQDRRFADQRQHGGFDAVFARTAVQNERDASVHVVEHVLCRRRARSAGTVCGRRRDRHAGFLDQKPCGLVRRHAHRDGLQPCGDLVRDLVRLVEDHRQRSRPEGVHQRVRDLRHMRPKILHVAFLRDVQDQRIVVRTSLCFEDAVDRFAVEPVCAESVHRFRRKRDKLAVLDQFRADRRSGILSFDRGNHFCLHVSLPSPPKAAPCVPQGSARRSFRPYRRRGTLRACTVSVRCGDR